MAGRRRHLRMAQRRPSGPQVSVAQGAMAELTTLNLPSPTRCPRPFNVLGGFSGQLRGSPWARPCCPVSFLKLSMGPLLQAGHRPLHRHRISFLSKACADRRASPGRRSAGIPSVTSCGGTVRATAGQASSTGGHRSAGARARPPLPEARLGRCGADRPRAGRVRAGSGPGLGRAARPLPARGCGCARARLGELGAPPPSPRSSPPPSTQPSSPCPRSRRLCGPRGVRQVDLLRGCSLLPMGAPAPQAPTRASLRPVGVTGGPREHPASWLLSGAKGRHRRSPRDSGTGRVSGPRPSWAARAPGARAPRGDGLPGAGRSVPALTRRSSGVK